MRKSVFVIIVSILALVSCKKELAVKADFTLDKQTCKVNEEIIVKNCSSAINTTIGLCKWEWDGKVSHEYEIGRISFASAGDYTITLTVYAEGGSASPSICSRTVKVVDDSTGPGDPDDPNNPDPGVTDRHYYVTVDGCGTLEGDSWENAMNAAKLWEKIHTDGIDANADAARIAAINGATFHLGAGDYELNSNPVLAYNQSSPVTLTFKGDYPSGGGDTQNRDGSCRACFTGNGTHVALALRGRINVTFDGIGFINSYGTSDEDAVGTAAALDCDGKDDAGYANAEISVSMTHCWVKGNTNKSFKTETHDDEWGAGIRLRNVKSFVADSVTFARNTSHAGAAICFRGTDATLTDCSFFDNEVYHKAGVAYVSGESDVKFTNCTFEGNSSQEGAGGVFYQNSRSSLTLTGCTFTGNKALNGDGGVILAVSGRVQIEGGLFSGNEAGYGGVIYAETGGEPIGIRIVKNAGERTQFLNNSASGKGGVMWASTQSQNEDKNVEISGAVFKGNNAIAGGALYIAGKNSGLNVTDCDFGGPGEEDPNYSTGAPSGSDYGAGSIYLQDRSYSTLRNCSFTGEHAQRWGGSIYMNTDKGSLTVDNCIFTDCHTNISGGAIIAGFKNFGELTINGGAFINCYSTDGGAILVDGKSGASLKIYKWNDLEGTLFQGNHVNKKVNTEEGGAVKIQHQVSVKMFGTAFKGNYAGKGGAIYVTDDKGQASVYLDACSFDANYITYRWGACIYAWNAGEFHINNTSMRGSYTTNPDPSDVNNARPAWIYFDSVPGRTSISNSTIIGDPQYYDGTTFTPLTDNHTCLVCTSTQLCLTNSIILPETPSIHSVEGDYADGSHEIIDAYYSYYSDLYGYMTVTDSGGNTGGLSRSSMGGLSWEEGCWNWNGQMGGKDVAKASRDNIYDHMNQYAPDFVSWLGGDFDFDQRHSDRGIALWWPGAYQEN